MKEITLWIEDCRRKLMEKMTEVVVVRGVDDYRGERGWQRHTEKESVSIVSSSTDGDPTGHWSDAGRFSLHKCRIDRSKVPPAFRIEVFDCTQDQWLENALQGDVRTAASNGGSSQRVFNVTYCAGTQRGAGAIHTRRSSDVLRQDEIRQVWYGL